MKKYVIDYFKPSGKWYSSADFIVEDDVGFYGAVSLLLTELAKGIYPGLTSVEPYFHVLIKTEDGLPHILTANYIMGFRNRHMLRQWDEQ